MTQQERNEYVRLMDETRKHSIHCHCQSCDRLWELSRERTKRFLESTPKKDIIGDMMLQTYA